MQSIHSYFISEVGVNFLDEEPVKEFQLEEPYCSVYRYGHLRTDPRTGRKQVRLTKHDGTTTTTSYARYLYNVSCGYFIPSYLDVDHINEDRTDDRIENLQLLTRAENIAKYHKHYRDNFIFFHDITCSHCGKVFKLSESELNARRINNKSLSERSKYYCSVKCVNESHRFSKEIIDKIKELDKDNVYSSEIARKLNVDIGAVIRYRQNLPKRGLGIRIDEETIKRINSFDPNKYSVKEVAEILRINKKSVAKYRKTKASTGKFRRLNKNIFERIRLLKEQKKSNAEIGRLLKIDASSVSRFCNGCYSKDYLTKHGLSENGSEAKLGLTHGVMTAEKEAYYERLKQA